MTSDKKNITSINEIGRVKFIKNLTNNIKTQQTTTKLGIGDDAAVLSFPDKSVLVTSQLFIEGIHFNLVYHPLKHLGYKIFAASVSNILAMNGTPSQLTISLGISGKFSVEAMDQLYEGIQLAADRFNVDIIGGDVKPSLTGLTIATTTIGHADQNNIVKRSGAKTEDLICVSGNLGAAYMGLQVLERERKIYEKDKSFQPELTGYDYIVQRELKPEPRYSVLEILQELNITPTSMIDVSEGLSSDLLHLCDQSNTGCKIYENKIPIDEETIKAADEFNISAFQCALNGGDDFELLFTISPNDFEKMVTKPEISIIGQMHEPASGKDFVLSSGQTSELTAQGWK